MATTPTKRHGKNCAGSSAMHYQLIIYSISFGAAAAVAAAVVRSNIFPDFYDSCH